MHASKQGVVLLVAALAAWVPACGPGDRLRFVELRTEDDSRSDGFFAPFRGTYSAPASRMRNTLSDVGSARYDIADRQRVYLFGDDLESGSSGRSVPAPSAARARRDRAAHARHRRARP
jgi:hypothetical protein